MNVNFNSEAGNIMNHKSLLVLFLSIVLITTGYSVFYMNNRILQKKENIADNKIYNKNNQTNQKNNQINNIQKVEKTVKKAYLYSEYDNNAIPLSAIAELTDLPEQIKKYIHDIIEYSNIYLLNKNDNEIIVLSENIEDIRHGLEISKISLDTHNITKYSLGGYTEDQENAKNVWNYDRKTKLPTKHTKLDENDNILYTEIWNYDSKSPIKYEMRDTEGKIISIKKETLDEHSNMRVENLFYDSKGHIEISITATYIGANIVRFTYYNLNNPNESMSLFSEYSDGVKIKETVYSSDYKVQKIYKSDYEDGIRTSLGIFDANNNKLEGILSE